MSEVSDQLRALSGTIIVLISQYFNIRRVSFSNIRLLINTVWLMSVERMNVSRDSTWKSSMIRMMLVD